jgi:CRP-like cAMP-binding protein
VSGRQSRRLRESLQRALERERLTEALGHYEALETIEPGEPRWPHRKGDLLKRLGRRNKAIEAYERAVELYAERGFVARAAAMAKVVLGLAPERIDVLERVSFDTARKLHRAARSAFVTADVDAASRGEEPFHLTKHLAVDAPPLVATDDLSRFTRPPAARHLSLDLEMSDLELEDPPLTLDEDDEPSAERLAQLPSMPLFAEVPKAVLATLVRESSLIDLEVGEPLIEAGAPADALFVLIEGSVELIRASDADAIVLAEGDVVGTSCLLERVSYEGDVTARTNVRALRISKTLLDRLVAEHPPLGDILLEILGRRLIATLVRTSPMFSSFDSGARKKVAAKFEVRRADQGTTILKAGKRADGLYIPMIGELTAFGKDGEELGRLKLGRALGSESMLKRSPSQLTVKATSDVLLLRLSARRFLTLVSAYPEVVAHLEELARRPSAPLLSLFPESQVKRPA